MCALKLYYLNSSIHEWEWHLQFYAGQQHWQMSLSGKGMNIMKC